MPLPREMIGGQCRQLGLSTGWDHPAIGAIPTGAERPMRVDALPWCQVDHTGSHQQGRNAWNTWRCCAALMSAARIRSS